MKKLWKLVDGKIVSSTFPEGLREAGYSEADNPSNGWQTPEERNGSSVTSARTRQRGGWTDSERQGGGRRYWFENDAAALKFARAKKKLGLAVLMSHAEQTPPSVWVGNKKNKNWCVFRSKLAGHSV